MRRRAAFAVSTLVVALTAVGGLGAGSQSSDVHSRVADQAKTVYVYDTDSGFDGFDHDCKGWVWSELGFLDDKGKPAADGTRQGDQIKVGGEVRGSVVSAKDKPNGYQNADGTKEAFDLARGAKLKDVYKRLKKGDRLVICKHGGSHTHQKPGGKVEEHLGGLIHLDGGGTFTGFKEENSKSKGTNVTKHDERSVGDPYVLPAPSFGIGTVKATLYSCYGSKVPGPGEKSVKQTLEDVLGAGTVEAFDGVVDAKVGIMLDVQDAASEEEVTKLQDKGIQLLGEAAKKAGFQAKDPEVRIKSWLKTIPFEDQYKKASDVIANDPELKGKVSALLHYPTPDPPVVVGPGAECPQFVIGGGVRLTYGTPAAILVLPSGSLGRLGLDMLLLQPDATGLPDGPGVLQSPVIQVARARDAHPELRTRLARKAQITLPYSDLDTIPEIYQLRQGHWVHLPTDVDKSRMRVSAGISRLGTFAAFSVPASAPSVTISEDDTWSHNQSMGLSNICINVRTSPHQASATVTLSGPGGYHSSSPPKTPLINGARQFTSPITVPGEYTKTITVYNAADTQTATVTKTFTVDEPPVNGPAATPKCSAPQS